jgi:hypothetical protein
MPDNIELEQLTATDSITFTKRVVTGVLLTLSLTSPLIWGMINENQTPGWVQITDGAGQTWTQVNDGTTSDWTQIPN